MPLSNGKARCLPAAAFASCTCRGSTCFTACAPVLLHLPSMLPAAGAFAIAQQRGEQDAFIRTFATDSLIVSKCSMEHPHEAQQVEGHASSQVTTTTAQALAAAIKEMRAKALPAVIDTVASLIEEDCRDGDLYYLQLTLQRAFGWGVAHHPAVANSIAQAYTQVRG
jgi:hypothetical protein